ncbi:hypothetical protein GCM10020366_58710 [Saccharopolyspora gregorii]|uniref:Uncharacterized protein n=1 Tax=Saccharopolyspora gregorii TaxID=33914 RepID=A0ABP6RZD0_9PSEU
MGSVRRTSSRSTRFRGTPAPPRFRSPAPISPAAPVFARTLGPHGLDASGVDPADAAEPVNVETRGNRPAPPRVLKSYGNSLLCKRKGDVP